jgi:putative addiction module component (TIGR02574 family)
MPDFQTILADASRLPVVDGIQLIEALWDTVPGDALPPLTDEWLAEIQRRSAEFDSGTVKTVPWEQVRADAMRRAGLTAPDAAG